MKKFFKIDFITWCEIGETVMTMCIGILGGLLLATLCRPELFTDEISDMALWGFLFATVF